ncbi:MAG: phosphatidylglycerol lysyltransferase domain-containing protein [Candidatus Thermoplasmatota archaeon]|jgi:hypothetical protein|nr:phosphatidylglycerol lysyltransferase domain-containing protein [Candidatus Thermoplasmatota archaeon]
MFSIEDFKPITLDDKVLFQKHYEKYPTEHSDNLFTTLFSWMDYGKYRYCFIDNNLLLTSQIKDVIQFRYVSGKYNKEIFAQLFKLAKQQQSDYPIILIDSQTKNWLLKHYPKLTFEPFRDVFDYVYLASDLANLPGSKYSKIRNRLNKFKKNFSYTTEAISEDNLKDVRDFLKRWCLWKDCDSDPLLENEKKAILKSMDYYIELELSGIAIIIDDKIEAISVYEKMTSEMAVVHYEKGSPDYDGIYKAINNETAKILQKNYKFINRESDMNLPGLRKAKMSYHTHHMVEVFNLSKQTLFNIV